MRHRLRGGEAVILAVTLSKGVAPIVDRRRQNCLSVSNRPGPEADISRSFESS